MKKYIFLTLGQGMLIFFFTYSASIIDKNLQEIAKQTFQVYPYILFNQFAYVPIGLILGFGYWITQKKREGSWKMDKIRLTIIGLPALYFLLVPYIVNVEPLFPLLMMTNSSLSGVIQVVVGYIFITSFHKS
ncbi:hypothetical protein [Halobacillus mangrovi]|uniref:hypothetical protein n=1 Tax=Halobacillus mangrovi TaxID=402384 RepID=UPI003D956F59